MAVKNRIGQLVEERGITRYRFWQDTKLSRATAYKLCDDPDYVPTGAILDKVCETYGVQPGDILFWVPGESDYKAKA